MAIRVVRLGTPRHQDEGVRLGTVRRAGILGLFPAADHRPVDHLRAPLPRRPVPVPPVRAAGATAPRRGDAGRYWFLNPGGNLCTQSLVLVISVSPGREPRFTLDHVELLRPRPCQRCRVVRPGAGL